MTCDARDLRRRQRRKDTIRMRDGGQSGIRHGPSECSQACEANLLDQGIGATLGRAISLLRKPSRSLEKASNERRDFVCRRVQREMPGIQDVHVGVWHIPPIGLRLG